jgi:hypothetical protein
MRQPDGRTRSSIGAEIGGNHVGNTTLSRGSLRHRRRVALSAESGLSVNYRILEPVLAYRSNDFDSKC